MIPDFMIFEPQTWLKWAGYFLPDKRKDWLTAMEAELTEMPYNARQSFALGCFRAALLEGARSRKGLNYIARGGGAILIVMACAIGIKFNLQPSEGAERIAVSKLLVGLCALYMGSAWLLIVSLRHLRVYAGIGLSAALSGWVYYSVAQPKLGALPLEFMTALSVEATGFMATLLLATIYLNWLYTPEWGEDV